MTNVLRKMSITIMIAILVLNISLYSKVFAFGELMNDGKDFINAGGQSSAQGITQDEIKGISNFVSGILLTIAVGVTLISGAVMAINFAIQSVEDKAKIKESMIPWIIGIFIAFGAYGIWRITMQIFYSLNL